MEVLVAGCGTGKHIFDVAERNPKARILAIDISMASLAYAKRKAREAHLANVEFAQADILELGTIRREFYHIEALAATEETPASVPRPVRSWSRPAAMTVTRTSSPRASSMTAPKMMFASTAAELETS